MNTAATAPMALTDAQFLQISDLVKRLCGINLRVGKKELVQARLAKRLRLLGMEDYHGYIEYLRQDATGGELTAMMDVLSTNLTSFFREADHFELLRQQVLEPLAAQAAREGSPTRLRIWSAGCSSGEEPYSIAVTLRETLGDVDRWDARILATDLSTVVLQRAMHGQYAPDRLKTLPPGALAKYFIRVGDRSQRIYRLHPSVRGLVHFARLNLIEPWPMRGPFQAIFCRNVMIYFDKPTQARLIERFWDLLGPGGLLFVGHSESLAGIQHGYQYVQPTVYRRP